MAPEKSPAFQFYPKEFLMDGNVAAMSLQERGAYITLICICWQEKSLPAEVGRLANIVGLPVKAFQKMWPCLSPCFVQYSDRLLHPRLEKERVKQAEYNETQRVKGEARAATAERNNGRFTISRTPAEAPARVQPAHQPDTSSPISYLRSPKKEKKYLEGADELWEQFKAKYPGSGREGGYMASQLFIAACESVGFDAVMAGLERYRGSKKVRDGYVIGMEKWLEKKLWIQEPEKADTSADDVAVMEKHLAAMDAERALRGR